jgi:hypothetical protein
VLDDLSYGVFLNVANENQLALALDLKVENGVLLTDEQTDLVSRNGYVLHGVTVTVNNCGDLAGNAKTASEALTELGADVCDDLVVNFSHEGLLFMRPEASLSMFNSNACQREERL